MFDRKQKFEYEKRRERIASQMENLILDAIIATLGKLHLYFRDDDMSIDKPAKNEEPF